MLRLRREFSPHASHESLGRLTRRQVRDDEIRRDRSPERNKIKTYTTYQVTHAISFQDSYQRLPGVAPGATGRHIAPSVAPQSLRLATPSILWLVASPNRPDGGSE